MKFKTLIVLVLRAWAHKEDPRFRAIWLRLQEVWVMIDEIYAEFLRVYNESETEE